MTSVAVRRRATGGIGEATVALRRAVRSETGLMICVFLVLRLIATVHAPSRYPDTPTYEVLNFVGAASRLWTVPLIWNLTPGADFHVAAHIVLGMFAWSMLAVSVSNAVRDRWVRRLATACVLMLGLVVQVTGWDATLLSESISLSLITLEAALLLRLPRDPSPLALARVRGRCLPVGVHPPDQRPALRSPSAVRDRRRGEVASTTSRSDSDRRRARGLCLGLVRRHAGHSGRGGRLALQRGRDHRR